MKNILLILAIAFSSASFGQGNLQFNQVVNYENTAFVPTSGSAVQGTITVPAGKVWKVETCSYVLVSGGNDFPYTSSNGSVHIGKNTVYYVISNQTTNYLPLWLGEGTYDITRYSQSGYTVTIAFSAIEFNVVP